MNNKILKNIFYFCSLDMALILVTLLPTVVNATHISQPILSIDENASYKINQTVSLNGWVKYNDQPASNVLVLLRLTNANGDGDEIF